MTEQFIELHTLQLESGGLNLVLAHYDSKRFQPDLFKAAAIDYPASLQNSVVKRQAEFLAGRIAAAHALRPYGLEQQPIGIGRQRQPIWPEGYVGSISHSQGMAVALIQPETEFIGVGLDLEARLSTESQQAMLSVVLNQVELQRLKRDAGSLSQAELLTLVFSAKESFFKAAYRQVQDYFDFDAIELVRLDQARKELHFRCVSQLSQNFVADTPVVAAYQWLNQTMVLTSVLLPASA